MTSVREKPATSALGIFAGRWHAEGPVHASANGPAAHWTSEEHYEWLPGERFMLNRWDARVAGRDFRGISVLGQDADRGYFAAFYDNGGHAPVYRVSVQGDVWTFAGEAQRATYTFSAGGAAMAVRWEWRDATGWHPLCDLSARRVRAAEDVIREYFAAFEAQDRPRLERLLDPDFSFSSPRDERLDQRAFFERCWPNAGKLRAFRIERLCEHDGEAFVRYSAERAADGARFRNLEHFRIARGSVQSVDVYFGRDL